MTQAFGNLRKGEDFDFFQLKATNCSWSFWVGLLQYHRHSTWHTDLFGGHWHLWFGVLFFCYHHVGCMFFHSRWQNNGKMHVSIAAGYKLPFPVWIHSPKKPASISLHLFHQWHFRPSITSPNPPVVSSRSCFFWRTHGIVHLRVLKHLKQRQDNHNLGGFCWREIRCGPQLKQKATTSFRKWL